MEGQLTPPAEGEGDPRLEVYLARSILVHGDGARNEFKEGHPTLEAKARLEKIRSAFEAGFLVDVIQECRKPDSVIDPIDPENLKVLSGLVDSVTSEVGRAIVGLSILQLAIKTICPEQSVRLHKGGGQGGNFSWAEGIPMRVLDKNYCTPTLRKFDLIKINADGVFMTRSLAENYPYSKLYKAALRGAREEWLELVDLIESEKLSAPAGLKHLLRMLFNRSDAFKKSTAKALDATKAALGDIRSLDDALRFMRGFIDGSTYSARIFEISLHSFFQVLEDYKVLDGFLKPLSQMRSANKKHGNVGDIEVVEVPETLLIIESWDAKYGKPYLREELDELHEKLKDHPETKLAGFVVDSPPNLKTEIVDRIKDIQSVHSVSVPVLVFEDWAKMQMKRVYEKDLEIAHRWVVAFAESLCQERRDRAPIDEPCDVWVEALAEYSKKWE